MSRVFFTADLHLGHRLVAENRGFTRKSAISAHDITLARRWDATVTNEDTVWVLGDLCAGGSVATRNALEWIQKRPGVKHLITGNHDKVHPMHRDAHRWQRTYLESGFESVQAFARRRIQGREVLLSHFPYEGDSQERSRFDQYRLPDEGLPIIHGHTHSPHRYNNNMGLTHNGAMVPQVHVGVDAWNMTPAPLEDVARIIDVALAR